MPASRVVLREVRRFAAAARPQTATDRDLLGRFVATRDGPAFAELVRRHGPMVLGLCRRVLAHAADADDAFQATFLVLVRKAHAVGDPDRLGPWLYGVAWRTANKVRARRRSLAALPDDLTDPRAAAADWPVDLDAAIARLPDKYRVPVVLCHLQGLTPAEAAERLGCPPSTVATRLSRARETLRKRLAARGLVVPAGLVAGAALHLPPALTAAAAGMAAGNPTPTPVARHAAGPSWSISMARFRVLAASALIVALTGVGLYGLRAGGQDPKAPPLPPPVLIPPPEAPALPPPALPATVTTENFTVTGPSQRIAKLVGDAAERARKDVAVAWLGKELPKWSRPVPIRASIRHDWNGGSTTFDFEGAGFQANMEVGGPLERVLADLVPHEVAHCVMADLFQKPLPRWADEGISVLSETDGEQERHAIKAAELAQSGRLIQTRALFDAKEYPADAMVLFAQGFYVTRFLVARKDRRTFLSFVNDGMADGWEAAAKKHYGFATLADLEAAYLTTIKSDASAPVLDKAPTLSLAEMAPGGRIVVTVAGPVLVPTTSYMKRERPAAGKAGPEWYYEPVTTWKRIADAGSRIVTADRVKALTLDGKPVDAATMKAALSEKQVPVVVTTRLSGIDPAFAAALKPGTLVLVLPAENIEAGPPNAPPWIPAADESTAPKPRVPPTIRREE